MTTLKSVNVYDSEDSPFTISPLPPVLHHGLAVVATIGFASFLTSFTLLSFLSYKMVKWQLKPCDKVKENQEKQGGEPESPAGSDLNGFLVPDDYLCPQKQSERPAVKETVMDRLRREPPNQFLILIFNLLFADMQQSMAFLLNVAWLTRDAVEVGTETCWAQGWFVSVGDLASSIFITTIAAHTYLAIVKSYRLPTRWFYTILIGQWSFIYGTAILGPLITSDGFDNGGYYVRAGAWCWINSAYQDLRLYLHYLWIFMSIALTTIIYTVIFFHIQGLAKKARLAGHAGLSRATSRAGNGRPSPPHPDLQPPGSPLSFASASTMRTMRELPPIPTYARQQTFLLYPAIYVLCTLPLAAGRIASMAGDSISLLYFCFAGAMIAANGVLDVALYATTRRSIVFSDAPPSQETGLETFAFMRTPPIQKFGNMVFVSGGLDFDDEDGQASMRKRWQHKWSDKAVRTGGQVGKLKTEASSSQDSLKGFGMGQGAVMGMAIQCETVTSVKVEVNGEPGSGSRSASRKGSVGSLSSIPSVRSSPSVRSAKRSLTG